MAIGANTWARNSSRLDKTWDHFDGQIADFTMFDIQMSADAIAMLTGQPMDPMDPMDEEMPPPNDDSELFPPMRTSLGDLDRSVFAF